VRRLDAALSDNSFSKAASSRRTPKHASRATYFPVLSGFPSSPQKIQRPAGSSAGADQDELRHVPASVRNMREDDRRRSCTILVRNRKRGEKEIASQIAET